MFIQQLNIYLIRSFMWLCILKTHSLQQLHWLVKVLLYMKIFF